MDQKILDFEENEGARSELWGDFSQIPISVAHGVAHAFVEADTAFIICFEPTGLKTPTGHIRRVSTRLAVPCSRLGALISQLSQIESAFRQGNSPLEQEAPESVPEAPPEQLVRIL